MAHIIDTKITPTRKRDRAGAVSGSDANPHSSPSSAPDSHDAKRVKRPVPVRWEPGMRRYADDEEFVPADNEDDDTVETATPRDHGASFGKKVRLGYQCKSWNARFLKLMGSSDSHHATTQVLGRVLQSRQIPLGQTRREYSFLLPSPPSPLLPNTSPYLTSPIVPS